MKTIQTILYQYLAHRPIFLSVLRAKEAALYQQFLPLKHPVLDVGCGDGFFANVTFGPRAIDTGLDIKESRVAEAKSSGAYRRIVTYDGTHIPLPARSQKTVVVNSVLEHVADLDAVVSEMYRVLDAGGTCLAPVMAAPWEEYLFGTKIVGSWYRAWMRKKQVHVNLLTYKQWCAVFTRAGFQIDTVHSYVSAKAGSLLDILHYVSLPSLIAYAVTRRWVLWSWAIRWYPMAYWIRSMNEPVTPARAGALFFILRRAKT